MACRSQTEHKGEREKNMQTNKAEIICIITAKLGDISKLTNTEGSQILNGHAYVRIFTNMSENWHENAKTAFLPHRGLL